LSLKRTPHETTEPGDKCSLMLHQADNKQPYQKVDAQIVRFESDVMALEFTEEDSKPYDFIDHLVQKELHFLNGVKDLIRLGREVAEQHSVGLSVLCFDNGELNPEREMHTMRLASGEHSINVHLHREEIEAFHIQSDSGKTRAKIRHAIERLNVND